MKSLRICATVVAFSHIPYKLVPILEVLCRKLTMSCNDMDLTCEAYPKVKTLLTRHFLNSNYSNLTETHLPKYPTPKVALIVWSNLQNRCRTFWATQKVRSFAKMILPSVTSPISQLFSVNKNMEMKSNLPDPTVPLTQHIPKPHIIFLLALLIAQYQVLR